VDDLEYAANHFRPDPLLVDNWGIDIGIPVGQGRLEFTLFGGYAVVPNSQLSQHGTTRLAVSIFMDANERFEEAQGQWGRLPIPVVGRRFRESYYSEEDLPSDIMGFYVGMQRRLTPGSTSEQFYEQIRDKCGAVGKDQSLDVFREDYKNGQRALTNWKSWSPRRLPLTGCGTSSLCSGSRAWPSEFSALTSARMHPRVDGAWWWYRDRYRDGSLVQTDRPRVYRFWQIPEIPTP